MQKNNEKCSKEIISIRRLCQAIVGVDFQKAIDSLHEIIHLQLEISKSQTKRNQIVFCENLFQLQTIKRQARKSKDSLFSNFNILSKYFLLAMLFNNKRYTLDALGMSLTNNRRASKALGTVPSEQKIKTSFEIHSKNYTSTGTDVNDK